MRVIVTGDRHWDCLGLAELVVARLVARHGADLVIVHGDATGVDRAFADAAEDAGVTVESHPAQWGEINHPRAVIKRDRNGHPYDSAAGPRRNGAMVARGAGLCLVVHRDLGASRGTKDCARQAIAAGIPTWLVASDDPDPARLSADDPRLA